MNTLKGDVFPFVDNMLRICEVPVQFPKPEQFNVDCSLEGFQPRQFLILDEETSRVITPAIAHCPKNVQWGPDGPHYALSPLGDISEILHGFILAHLSRDFGCNFGIPEDRITDTLEWITLQRAAQEKRNSLIITPNETANMARVAGHATQLHIAQ